MLINLKEKKLFNSSIIKKDDQIYLHKNIDKIEIYKGNLADSDICFIKKNKFVIILNLSKKIFHSILIFYFVLGLLFLLMLE